MKIEKSLSSTLLSHLVHDVLLSQQGLTKSPFSPKTRKNAHFQIIVSCLAKEFSALDASGVLGSVVCS